MVAIGTHWELWDGIFFDVLEYLKSSYPEITKYLIVPWFPVSQRCLSSPTLVTFILLFDINIILMI